MNKYNDFSFLKQATGRKGEEKQVTILHSLDNEPLCNLYLTTGVEAILLTLIFI